MHDVAADFLDPFERHGSAEYQVAKRSVLGAPLGRRVGNDVPAHTYVRGGTQRPSGTVRLTLTDPYQQPGELAKPAALLWFAPQ